MTDVNQSDYIGPSGALKDSPSYTIVSGDLEAMFLPGFGMIGTSLRHQGTEILRCIEDLDALAAKGSVAGIPLLHPWANRLAAHHYRVAGQEVRLDPSSPLLHHDKHGLPIHGVPWPHLVGIKVERPVTQPPPHRSRRAVLPHRALQICSFTH